MAQGIAILIFLIGREVTWEKKMFVFLRCLDALLQDYRDMYGREGDTLPDSLEEEFRKWRNAL